MPVKTPQIIIPTGYESQQRAAERKRKIAQALMERGLATNPNMQSWTQVLGQLGNAFAGTRLDKKADRMSDETDAAIKRDYADRIAKFNAATSDANADPATIVKQFGADPWLREQVDPYRDAMAARLKERENIVKTPTTYGRAGDLLGKPLPNDPNDMVVLGPNGEWVINKPRAVAAAVAGGTAENPNEAMNYVGADPRMQPQGMPAMPAQPQQPVGTNLLDQLSPEDKQIMTQMLEKYAGKGASLQGIVPNNVPYGNPTMPGAGGGKPPDGITTDGKPYWMVNGVPYDNPEGQ